jgi:hypothetical protein
MSTKFHNNLTCRQSEESRFPSRRRFAPPQDDAGRLEDKAGMYREQTLQYSPISICHESLRGYSM